MLKKLMNIILLTALIFTAMQTFVYARMGDSGYEGGISSGEAPGRTVFDYKEVVFITGEPMLFEGTLTITKNVRQDNTTGENVITSNYTYRLNNFENSATLNRTLSYETVLNEKKNGQTIEETILNDGYSETIRIENETYRLENYDYTRTNIKHSNPAVDYYAGNMWGRKTYQEGNGANGATVTVDVTGEFYGYNQYWGTTETQTLDYVIQSQNRAGEFTDKWGGTASVNLSSTTSQNMRYVKNKPETISFEGGFVQTQHNNSVLRYTSSLPEFDLEGMSTDRIVEEKDSLQIETFPASKRLMIPDINHLRGHWAHEDIMALYSLEVFNDDASKFNPRDVMTRAEFADAIIHAAREVPEDPALINPRANRRINNNDEEEVAQSFFDVLPDDKYYDSINSAFNRGIISGRGDGRFYPEDYLTTADAITILISTLGLAGLAPTGGAATTFRDNSDIPGYARDSVYAAQRIGLIVGDDRGYLKPMEYITKGRAAVIINKYIDYMRDDLNKDYRERIINY
ncbi:S-layer homology domain-containing protein [Herbivorax sp. ANBcel31]|uniref:S-layer homology domain-containing protein n=1 Tax=Herbivorax sp. ANBcel31 TaxID=3069754 RepID=UPI0027B0DA74|nr:S-layer homology domain-containing protein [Herbivorax sp. ANBcel31]MDQ2084968.1 S-layer homology domain-containing protein [Herbivorax sp. ANBcel31]